LARKHQEHHQRPLAVRGVFSGELSQHVMAASALRIAIGAKRHPLRYSDPELRFTATGASRKYAGTNRWWRFK
jgi:hypothetical protein